MSDRTDNSSLDTQRSWSTRVLDRVPGGLARRARGNFTLRKLLGPYINRFVSDYPQVVTVRSGAARGIKLVILPRLEKYYWAGTHEVVVQDALVSSLQPGEVVWDVGAHCGFFSLLSSRLVGPSGQVVCFEPVKANRDRLKRGIEANSATNLTVLPFAVSSVPGEVTTYAHEYSTHWSLFPKDGRTVGGVVSCTSLDDVSRDVPPPSLIKIDIEGAEVEALRGGKDLMARHRPRLIVEFHEPELVREAKAMLPAYHFQSLDGTQWYLTPVE